MPSGRLIGAITSAEPTHPTIVPIFYRKNDIR